MSAPCPGSNGIREWIAAQARSQPPLTWLQFLTSAFMVIVLVTVLGMSACHASPSCMTFSEARHEHPNEYLAWHSDHCWFAKTRAVRSAHAEMRAVPVPKPKPFILLLEQPPQEWIYADRWWIS